VGRDPLHAAQYGALVRRVVERMPGGVGEHELGALKKRIHILEGFETVFDALEFRPLP